MKKRLIEKFNQPNSLVVISGYPKKKQTYSQGVCAVSSFTKNTLSKLQHENSFQKIIVLAPTIHAREIYEEDGILVVRCFKRNSPLSYVGLLKAILRFGRVTNILIEFEFASFGNTFMTSLLIPIVWLLFLLGKNLVLVIHQVVSDIQSLSGHIGVEKRSLKMQFLGFSLGLFYALLTIPAKKIVVLEEEFKHKLSRFVNKDKIIVIPHGIDTNIKIVDRQSARKKLGIKNDEFAVLYFGYLTWYKGIDFLIQALKNETSLNGKKIRLVIAGGPSFTQGEKYHYKRFLRQLDVLMANATNITYTGFVKEEALTSVFTACDLAVLPYRTFMSSSGPLSLAISHAKPFILSENLEALFNSADFKKALQLNNLDKNQLIFKLAKKNLLETIKISMDPEINQKMVSLSKTLKEERSFIRIAKIYNDVLFRNKIGEINAIYSLAPANN